MNLNQYKKYYYTDEGHWYLSKIKQYNEKSINCMAKGLLLFSKLLSPKPNLEIVKKFQKFRPQDLQIPVFEESNNTQIVIDIYSKLFLSLQILENELIDLTQMKQRNIKKYNQFLQIKTEFKENRNYEFFIEKYGNNYLKSDLEVYFRNFESWLSKFGFYGHLENEKYCFITESGFEFMLNSENQDYCSAIFLNQIKKIQIWNPTIIEKYNDIKVLPYYAIIQILLKIPDNQLSKIEYVLFVTKLKTHNKSDIERTVKLILEFRNLSAEQQKKYIDSIENLDKKHFPERERTNYRRISDSATKEMDAYTFGSLFLKERSVVKLLDLELAKKEILEFQKKPQFIEFGNKYEWIRHLGSLNGLSINEIVDLYVIGGKSKEEIRESLKNLDEKIDEKINERFLEKQVEDYYEKNLKEIDPNLEIVKKPKYGRQFPTHIGTIDLLCIHKDTKEYYVVEFKRSQVSDDTIGQVLRYMGWIYLNLTKAKKTVRAIIVGSEFSDKIHYSFIGIQSNHIYQLIRTFKHPFSEQNKPEL